MLKQAFATIALAGLVGCSASMGVDPNQTRASSNDSTYYASGRNDSASVSTNSDRYDNTYDARVASDRNAGANADVNTRTDTYSYRSNNGNGNADMSYRSGSSSDRNDDGPIWTDPIGRPERAARQTQQDLQASASGSSNSGSSSSYSSRSDRDATTASGRIDTDGMATRNDVNGSMNSSSGSSANANADANAGNASPTYSANSNGNSNLSAQDRAFIDQAANGGMFEVRSSRLITDRLNNDTNAKNFAQMMIDDHSKANKELKSIAKSKGVQVRNDLRDQQKSMYDTLSNENGSDLLSTYRQQQIQAHEDTIKLFEDEANTGQDQDLKSFAQRTLPTLRHHLEAAKTQLSANDMNKQ